MPVDAFARTLAASATVSATGAAASATSAAASATTATTQAGAVAAALNSSNAPFPNAYASTLPQGVLSTTITAAGTGGTSGTYALGVSGGPTGFAGTYTISGGGVTAITITNPGLSTSNTAPTLSFPSGGVTGATATATVGSIVLNQRTYWVASADSSQILLYGNNGGSVATAPFGGTQLVMYAKAGVDTAVTSASNSATAAAASAAAAAATAATTGILSSSSIRFPDYNLQFAGQWGLLKQSRTNMPAILNTADSHIIGCMRLPREKTNQNRVYALFGNASGQSGQFQLFYNGTNVTGTNAGKLVWSHRQNGGGGTALTLIGPTVDFDDFVFKVSRTLVGGTDITYNLDVWKVSDGSKVAGVTQTNPASVAGIASGGLAQTFWYIGYGQTVANEPTITTALTAPAGGGIGEMEFLGFYSGTITDTNMSNIALGSNPLTELTAANFGYYRRFLGTDSVSLAPVSGTGDTTSAATLLGYINAGSNIRRQGTTNYLTLTRIADGYIFGCRKGEDTQPVTFAGSLAGVAYSGILTVPKMAMWGHREVRHLNGYVWGRVVLDDGSVHVPWTRLVRLVNSATEGLTFVERSRFGVGIKHVFLGQSQLAYMFGSGGTVARTLTRALTTAPGGSMAGPMYDLSANPVREQIRVFDGPVTFSDGIAAFLDEVSSRAGCLVQAVDLSISGSDPLEWIKPAGVRPWSGSVTTMGVVGTDISSVSWQWYSSQQSQGSAFGTNILDAVVKGIGANANTNWMGNGLFRNGYALVLSGFTRVTTGAAGPLTTDANAASSGIPEARTTARSWALSNGFVAGPAIIDMQVDSSGGPHEAGTVYGTVRFGLREAEACLRALGISQLSDGTIGTPVFNGGKTTITLTATLPNIGGLRVDDTATYANNVQGFEISTDGGTTWSNTGFTAALGATSTTRNQVILTKSSGDWTAFSAGQVRVRYAWGGPLALGTSVESSLLIRGLLYDGSNPESGLGLPLLPMAATAAV